MDKKTIIKQKNRVVSLINEYESGSLTWLDVIDDFNGLFDDFEKYINENGENSLKDLLTSEKFNQDEISQIFKFTNSVNLNAKTEEFFHSIDIGKTIYVSPLSDNKKWLNTEESEDSKSGIYKNLIRFMEIDFGRKESAECLAILDTFVDENYGNSKMQGILSKFKTYNSNNKNDVQLLADTLNESVKRYSSKNGSYSACPKNVFTVNSQGKLKFSCATKGMADAVIKNNTTNTNIILVATSKDNTESQNPVYKHTRELVEHFGDTQKYKVKIYCDAIIKDHEKPDGSGRHPFGYLDKVKSLEESEKASINILGMARVLLVKPFARDIDSWRDIFSHSTAQFFDSPHSNIFNQTQGFEQRAELIKQSTLKSVGGFNKDPNFWIGNGLTGVKGDVFVNTIFAAKWLLDNKMINNKDLYQIKKMIDRADVGTGDFEPGTAVVIQSVIEAIEANKVGLKVVEMKEKDRKMTKDKATVATITPT